MLLKTQVNNIFLSSVILSQYLNKNGDTMSSTLNFNTGIAIGSIFKRARIALWNDESAYNWYGYWKISL